MKMIEKVIERNVSSVIIIADKNSNTDKIETYISFIDLFNNLSNKKHRLYCDFKKDYYEIDLKNISDTLIKLDEITGKINNRAFVLVNKNFNEEMKKYYERVEPYFKFMARSVGKYVDISPYIESLSILTN